LLGAAAGTISELRADMARPSQPVLLALALSISIAPLAAEAGRRGGDGDGGGGGGGRLGQVSSGLGRATGGGGGSSGGGGSPAPVTSGDVVYRDHRYDGVTYVEPVVVLEGGGGGAPDPAGPARPHPVSVDFFAGAQKVYESDGSLSLELAFNERRFRLGGSLTRYFERQEGSDALTFTLGTLYLGLRIDDGGPTRVHLEGGVVGARTRNDPVMDSSVAGVFGGVRVEHRTSRRVWIVGDAQLMGFEQDVGAGALRAGIRVGHLQATLRYLDLNVGPALFGPEVGLRF